MQKELEELLAFDDWFTERVPAAEGADRDEVVLKLFHTHKAGMLLILTVAPELTVEVRPPSPT